MSGRVVNGWSFGGLSVALLFLSFLSLWQRDQMTRVGYAIQKLQQEKAQLMKLHRELLIEVESLSALDRIEAVATRQLSMAPPLPGERIYVGPASNSLKDMITF